MGVSVQNGTFLNTSPERYVTVHVARKTSISGFTVSLNKYAELTAGGYLHTGSSTPATRTTTYGCSTRPTGRPAGPR
ncbi:hypothetical protein ABZZ47_00915 [Streptomyces sp. NPDC006465]|uniref:hypothetical protein n=1 Tax=Streptomyces sp. NPDC006465 TaxID=3157174 RepID=UPI0033AC3BEE